MKNLKSFLKKLYGYISMEFKDSELEKGYVQQSKDISKSRYIALKIEYYLILLVSLPVGIVLLRYYNLYQILIEWGIAVTVAIIEYFAVKALPKLQAASKFSMWTLALTILINYIKENSKLTATFGGSLVGDSSIWDGFVLAMISLTFTRSLSNYWIRLLSYQIVFSQ